MTKDQAVELFSSVKALADAMGITPAAIYQWPEQLSSRQADEILGAALRIGRITPDRAAQIARAKAAC